MLPKVIDIQVKKRPFCNFSLVGSILRTQFPDKNRKRHFMNLSYECSKDIKQRISFFDLNG